MEVVFNKENVEDRPSTNHFFCKGYVFFENGELYYEFYLRFPTSPIPIRSDFPRLAPGKVKGCGSEQTFG